jgi:transposase
VRRAQTILYAADGMSNERIAQHLGTSRHTAHLQGAISKSN